MSSDEKIFKDKENEMPSSKETAAPSTEESSVSDTGAEKIDLQKQIEAENGESEMLPPEEETNEARQLNLGNIFAAAFGILGVIVFVFFLFSGKSKKAEAAQKELDKSGAKFEQEFVVKQQAQVKNFEEPVANKEDEMTDEEVDKILATLPPEYQRQGDVGQAPISHVGSTGGGSSKSTRPDTRNSKSPRKIEGLKNMTFSTPQQNAPPPYGQYGMGAGQLPSPATMSKEDYAARVMGMANSMASQYAGGGPQQQAYQNNRESFFQKGQGEGGGGGYWLPENTVWDGTVISAALETQINTDNPGAVVARVTENVWSSRDASYLLIPAGTLLFATYNSSVSYGQSRVQVAWNLMIRPDGYRVSLGNMNGVDAQGASGYNGIVNNHPFQTLKALGLVAVYSIIQTEINSSIANEQNEYMKNAMTDVYAQASNIGNKIVDRALDIKPTIVVKQGTEVKLITNQPLTLPPVQIDPVTHKYVRYR